MDNVQWTMYNEQWTIGSIAPWHDATKITEKAVKNRLFHIIFIPYSFSPVPLIIPLFEFLKKSTISSRSFVAGSSFSMYSKA